jgi:flavin-binding protein dodecin
MGGHTYSISEVVGTSEISIEDAVQSALATAHETARTLEWFEIGQWRGPVAEGRTGAFQVHVRLGYRYDRA